MLRDLLVYGTQQLRGIARQNTATRPRVVTLLLLPFRVEHCSRSSGPLHATPDAPVHGVSSLGRVRSLNGIKGYGSQTLSGYYQARIKGRGFLVHRLVAEVHLGPPPTEAHTQVNHKDGDPSNNRVENLEWVTHAENVQHSFATNLNRASNAPKRSKPVVGGVKGSPREEWKEYESISAAARALGLKKGSISDVLHGKSTSAGGARPATASCSSGHL